MATFDELRETVEHYGRFREQFDELVKRLQAPDSAAAPLRLTWGERVSNAADFVFLDVTARLRFVVVHVKGEHLGKLGVERLRDGLVEQVVAVAYFDEQGYVYLDEPMRGGLVPLDPASLQKIAAHLLSPLVAH
jgi:hypothetical protein